MVTKYPRVGDSPRSLKKINKKTLGCNHMVSEVNTLHSFTASEAFLHRGKKKHTGPAAWKHPMVPSGSSEEYFDSRVKQLHVAPELLLWLYYSHSAENRTVLTKTEAWKGRWGCLKVELCVQLTLTHEEYRWDRHVHTLASRDCWLNATGRG